MVECLFHNTSSSALSGFIETIIVLNRNCSMGYVLFEYLRSVDKLLFVLSCYCYMLVRYYVLNIIQTEQQHSVYYSSIKEQYIPKYIALTWRQPFLSGYHISI